MMRPVLHLLFVGFCWKTFALVTEESQPRPAPPEEVKVERLYGNYLNISYQAPANSPVPIYFYRIEYRTVGPWEPLATWYFSTYYVWSRASIGVKYHFRVISVAVNSVKSESSDEVNFQIIASPPENLRIANLTSTSVRFEWDTPVLSSDDVFPIYEVLITKIPENTTRIRVFITDWPTTTVNVLKPDAKYQAMVRRFPDGLLSNVVLFETPEKQSQRRPAPPKHLKVELLPVYGSYLNISFHAPANSPLPIHHYRIEYRTVGPWGPLATVYPRSDSTWYVWSRASTGAKYQFRVISLTVDSVESESSDEVNFHIKASPPENLRIANLTATSVQFKWDTPVWSSDDVFPIYEVVITKIPENTTSIHAFITVLPTATVNDLKPGAIYQAMVRRFPDALLSVAVLFQTPKTHRNIFEQLVEKFRI